MKRFLTSAKTALAAVAMTLLFALQGNAQDFNRIGLSYELETLNQKHGDNWNLNGFGIGYLHGFQLSSKVPVYLETDLKITAGFWGDSEKDDEDQYGYIEYNYNLTKLSIAVPVNVSYMLKLQNGISIQPYLGLNFKINALANYKTEGNLYEEEDNYYELVDSASETVNLLKGEGSANVFQLGWHVGVGFNYRWFNFGLGYGTDFINFSSHKPYTISSSTFSLTVGYNF